MWECSAGSVFKRASPPPPSPPPSSRDGENEFAEALHFSFFIHPAVHCLVLLILPPPHLLNWICQWTSLVCANSRPGLELGVDVNWWGSHGIFNSAGSFAHIISTFAQMHVLSKSVYRFMSVWLIRDGLFARGTTVTTHTRVCRVSLESGEEMGGVGAEGRGGGFGGSCIAWRFWWVITALW